MVLKGFLREEKGFLNRKSENLKDSEHGVYAICNRGEEDKR